ncbi:hypothetical protein FB45DRAFT_1001132 [Roridomyces roridus]|uniref:Uncharacterized protein n=1 Tax=Roridomyces roridus TaxID=1738132 RepID=A0AAD7FVC8_9AGAR|nr:hypothetical protein FB45DRAFT_1001132 [Roridomyces roridus]
MKNNFVVDYGLLGPEARKVFSELRDNNPEIQQYDVRAQATRLETLLAQLDVGADAHACIIDADSDMATEWYNFADARSHSRLVRRLVFFVVFLFSFFYVALWAAVFHPSGNGLKHVHLLRSYISGERRREDATAVLRRLVANNPDYKCGRFLNFLGPVSRDWLRELETLFISFDQATREESHVEKLRLIFFTAAYQGVADFIAVISKHRESLASYSQWRISATLPRF